MSVTLDASHDGAVRRLTVPGGELDKRTATELVTVATDLVEDRAVRVVTLTARSSSFCDGPAADLDPLSFDPDPAAVLSRLRVPVVSGVGGSCSSVGLELVLATDIVADGPPQSSLRPEPLQTAFGRRVRVTAEDDGRNVLVLDDHGHDHDHDDGATG